MACSINSVWSQTDIGKRMRMARLRAGLTLAQVGTYLGVTGQQVNKYETGRNTLSATTLAALVDIFDVTPAWLLGRDDAVDLRPSIQHAREEARILEAFARIGPADHRKVALMAIESIASVAPQPNAPCVAGAVEPLAHTAEGMGPVLLF